MTTTETKAPAGFEIFYGMFEVTPGIEGLRLQSVAYSQVKTFVEHYQKLGFELKSEPQYQLVPDWDVRYVSAGTSKGVQLWKPGQTKGMPKNHPWYVDDADQYQCWAWFYKRPEKVRIEVPDDYIKEHGLPEGFKEV